MLRDIESKEDLEILVNTFYGQVRADALLGPIFQEIIGDDWSHHLPIMYSFWNTVLFGAEGYKGQAVGKHVEIDRKIPLLPEHFERWISIWKETVDRLFRGDNAVRIVDKAGLMLQLIQFKVQAARSGKSLY